MEVDITDNLIFSVAQLNNYVKRQLETDPNLVNIYLVGEISNFTNHIKSGHFYMSLKDDSAVIKAVMFRSAASRVQFVPENGMRVVCRGRVSLYERDGSYQFYIDQMQPDGAGALQLAFEQLTAKLRAEGLFDAEHKLPIPRLPRRVAVITSDTGAAVQDIRNILSRRMPSVEVIMCPVLVQGEGAAAELTAAVERVNRLDCADVIIIGRGGGSLEDLFCFNDEVLARAIFASHIPVISAVGHETDYTVCDFVADLRAPTPSAAAELAVPDRRGLMDNVYGSILSCRKSIDIQLDRYRLRLRHCMQSRYLCAPEQLFEGHRERLDYSVRDLNSAYSTIVSDARQRLSVACARASALDPMATLARGYCVASKGKNIVYKRSDIVIGDTIDLQLSDGHIGCIISDIG